MFIVSGITSPVSEVNMPHGEASGDMKTWWRLENPLGTAWTHGLIAKAQHEGRQESYWVSQHTEPS